MISKGNPLLTGARGKVGNIVVKQYGDQTVITAVPDMSRRKLTQKQKDANEQMHMAIVAAKSLTENPQFKQRTCEMLKVEPNKVFRAIVKQWLLTDGKHPIFRETEQETLDKKTLATLKSIITAEIPDAEIMLFGNRAKGAYNAQTDWDILILANDEQPKDLKWELQEKLLNITIQQGARVNMLLAQKNRWYTEKEFEVIRKRIEKELLAV
ncbi:nucleotidyltransferase domain-containing protein [Niastella sp. OAS944]|jgi:predicted nucleotidyltransferase|uniref:nucleotidyltransferase domain-containing protein n=1 Tax=Niastella sp. OAS944 TaxID=2664089 RepID=UPI0034977CED|nr:putative nucleotidyltransferase [Chitinophagaceae bacterium OAS944]